MIYSVDSAIEILERTVPTLRSLLEGLSDEWIYGNEGFETWSPFDVVGHLIHGEQTDWIPRAEIILREGEDRTFEPFDRFAHFRTTQGKSLAELLDELEEVRTENLRRLRAMEITPELLNRRGTHPEFGSVTLRQLLATWVAHDLGHITQITRVMATQYREECGPCQAYLPVLRHR